MKSQLFKHSLTVLTASTALMSAVVPAHAQSKPNILVIMGDDIGANRMTFPEGGSQGPSAFLDCSIFLQ